MPFLISDQTSYLTACYGIAFSPSFCMHLTPVAGWCASSLCQKVAKQAKLLGQKLKVDAAREDSGGEEDEDGDTEGERAAKWGKKKRDYYNADTHEYE
eukprot:scaffold678054_cov43-Prasinocladus_malaysianus.AAC.1